MIAIDCIFWINMPSNHNQRWKWKRTIFIKINKIIKDRKPLKQTDTCTSIYTGNHTKRNNNTNNIQKISNRIYDYDLCMISLCLLWNVNIFLLKHKNRYLISFGFSFYWFVVFIGSMCTYIFEIYLFVVIDYTQQNHINL